MGQRVFQLHLIAGAIFFVVCRVFEIVLILLVNVV